MQSECTKTSLEGHTPKYEQQPALRDETIILFAWLYLRNLKIIYNGYEFGVGGGGEAEGMSLCDWFVFKEYSFTSYNCPYPGATYVAGRWESRHTGYDKP